MMNGAARRSPPRQRLETNVCCRTVVRDRHAGLCIVNLNTATLQSINARLQQRRAELALIRNGVRERREQGTSGIACCNWLSDQIDDFLRSIVAEQLQANQKESADSFALLAVGGNGRRRPAPFSDVDLLFVVDPKHFSGTQTLLAAVVRDCWDAGIQLGSSIRSPADVVKFASEDFQFATSLIETRLQAGNPRLAESTLQQVRARVFSDRPERLILKLIGSRLEEWLSGVPQPRSHPALAGMRGQPRLAHSQPECRKTDRQPPS